MELVQDLFLTTSLALILSFLVAKLVAMAVAGRESETEFGEGGDAGGEGVGAEELFITDPTKLRRLHIELEEKETRIQELKKQIASTKLRLQEKKSVTNVQERMETLKSLIEIYKSLREEHNALLVGRFSGSNN
ncbi:hypothetical protein TB1_029580 [Malus domestica]